MSKHQQLPLTDDQRQQLERRFTQATGRERRRVEAVLLYHQSHSTSQVAATLQVSINSIYHWLHRFQAEGLVGLQDRPRSGRPRKADGHYRQLLADLAQNPSTQWTAEELRQTMAERTGVLICHSYVRKLLKQMGFAYCWTSVAA